MFPKRHEIEELLNKIKAYTEEGSTNLDFFMKETKLKKDSLANVKTALENIGAEVQEALDDRNKLKEHLVNDTEDVEEKLKRIKEILEEL